MQVVISVHFDIARPIMFFKLDETELRGLVDNFAGVFVAYQTGRSKNVPVYFTNYEELDYDGAIAVANEVEKDTFVIVVDTITDVSEYPAYIGNIYGVDAKLIEEKFANRIKVRPEYFEETEDETYIYGKKGFKTLYFGVPIPGKYHVTDNSVTLKTMDDSSQILGDLIEWLRTL